MSYKLPRVVCCPPPRGRSARARKLRLQARSGHAKGELSVLDERRAMATPSVTGSERRELSEVNSAMVRGHVTC